MSAQKFNYELKKFIIKRKKVNKKIISIKAINVTSNFLKTIKKKLKKNRNKINHKIIIEAERSNNSKILINLFDDQVSIYKNDVLPDNCHYFKIETNEFNQWLKGKLTFEEVLGSRRFRYIRKPNVYSVEIMQIYTNYL